MQPGTGSSAWRLLRKAGETDAGYAIRCEEHKKRADSRRDDWATKRQPENEAHTAARRVDERLLTADQYRELYLIAQAPGHRCSACDGPVEVAAAIRHTTTAPWKTFCSTECSTAATTAPARQTPSGTSLTIDIWPAADPAHATGCLSSTTSGELVRMALVGNALVDAGGGLLQMCRVQPWKRRCKSCAVTSEPGSADCAERGLWPGDVIYDRGKMIWRKGTFLVSTDLVSAGFYSHFFANTAITGQLEAWSARSQGLGSDVSLQSKRMVTLFATVISAFGTGYIAVREDLLFGGAVCPICAELGCRAASVDFSGKYGRKGGAKVDESAADRGAHRLTAQREARVAAQLRTPRCLLMDRPTVDDYVMTDFRTRVALGLLSASQAAKMTDCPTVQFKCNSHGVDTDPALSSDWLEVAKEKQLGVAMCSHNVVLAAISTPMNENSSLIRALLYSVLSGDSFRVYTRVTVGANGVLEFIKFMVWIYDIACQLLVNTKAIFQKTHGTQSAPTPPAADVPAFTVMTKEALATAAADTVFEGLAEEVAEALIEQFFVEQPLTAAERSELRTRELAEEAAIRTAAAEAAATKKAAEDRAAYLHDLLRLECVQMGIGAFHAPVHKDACLLERSQHAIKWLGNPFGENCEAFFAQLGHSHNQVKMLGETYRPQIAIVLGVHNFRRDAKQAASINRQLNAGGDKIAGSMLKLLGYRQFFPCFEGPENDDAFKAWMEELVPQLVDEARTGGTDKAHKDQLGWQPEHTVAECEVQATAIDAHVGSVREAAGSAAASVDGAYCKKGDVAPNGLLLAVLLGHDKLQVTRTFSGASAQLLRFHDAKEKAMEELKKACASAGLDAFGVSDACETRLQAARSELPGFQVARSRRHVDKVLVAYRLSSGRLVGKDKPKTKVGYLALTRLLTSLKKALELAIDCHNAWLSRAIPVKASDSTRKAEVPIGLKTLLQHDTSEGLTGLTKADAPKDIKMAMVLLSRRIDREEENVPLMLAEAAALHTNHLHRITRLRAELLDAPKLAAKSEDVRVQWGWAEMMRRELRRQSQLLHSWNCIFKNYPAESVVIAPKDIELRDSVLHQLNHQHHQPDDDTEEMDEATNEEVPESDA